jgi:hypothetical protein
VREESPWVKAGVLVGKAWLSHGAAELLMVHVDGRDGCLGAMDAGCYGDQGMEVYDVDLTLDPWLS